MQQLAKLENSNQRAHDDLAKATQKNDGQFALCDDRFKGMDVRFRAVGALEKETERLNRLKATTDALAVLDNKCRQRFATKQDVENVKAALATAGERNQRVLGDRAA